MIKCAIQGEKHSPSHRVPVASRTDFVDCLTKNNYDEAKCQNAVNALYECCEAFYARYGEKDTPTSCPTPKMLRSKRQQQKDGK